MRSGWAAPVAAVVMVLAVVSGCSSSSSGASAPKSAATTLRVADIPAAVAAVEKARPGPLSYTEINAFDAGVNLFVAVSDTQEVSYVFHHDGTLDAPGTPATITSKAYRLDGVRLDLGPTLIREVESRFSGATILSVAIVQTSDLGLVWGVKTRSSKGGIVDVLFSPTGALLAASPE